MPFAFEKFLSGARQGGGDMDYVPDPMGRLGQGEWRKRQRRDPFGRLAAPRPEERPQVEPHNVFKLKGPVGLQGRNDREDVAKVEALLGATGDLDLKQTGGVTGFAGGRTDEATRRFQKRNGLTVDGQINPDGETIRALAGTLRPSIAAPDASDPGLPVPEPGGTSPPRLPLPTGDARMHLLGAEGKPRRPESGKQPPTAAKAAKSPFVPNGPPPDTSLFRGKSKKQIVELLMAEVVDKKGAEEVAGQNLEQIASFYEMVQGDSDPGVWERIFTFVAGQMQKHASRPPGYPEDLPPPAWRWVDPDGVIWEPDGLFGWRKGSPKTGGNGGTKG